MEENDEKNLLKEKRERTPKDNIIIGVHEEKEKILSPEEIKKKEHNRKKKRKAKN